MIFINLSDKFDGSAVALLLQEIVAVVGDGGSGSNVWLKNKAFSFHVKENVSRVLDKMDEVNKND